MGHRFDPYKPHHPTNGRDRSKLQSGEIAFHRTLVAAMGLSNHHPPRHRQSRTIEAVKR
jgi:hypothetical protein